MINEVMTFWNLLPQDTKGFIISVAANMASTLFPEKRIGNRVEKALAEAFEEGYKYFLVHFGENCSYFIKDLLNDNEAKSFFMNLVKDESLADHIRPIENAISRVGIDTSTIDGFNINRATQSFLQGFTAKAELSEALIPFLSLQKLKKVEELLTPHEEKINLDGLRKIYFSYLQEKYGYLSFKGLSEGKLVSIPLNELYTKLTFSEEFSVEKADYMEAQEDPENIELRQRGRQKSAVILPEILSSQYYVITGAPGAGKSTLLKFIALAFAERKSRKRLGMDETLMPILFPVAAFAEGCKKASSLNYSLEKFIPEYFQGENLPDLSALFSHAAQNGRAFFLIDGLDEVSDEAERKKMVESIRRFMFSNDNTKNRYAVTCRTASYTKASRFEPVTGKEFLHYRVLPFSMDQIEKFLLSWYRWYQKEIYQRTKTFEIEAKKSLRKMLGVISEDKNILSICTNPLMLTILALIEHEGGELPKNRADLYAKCLKMLAGSWENLRSLYETEKQEFKLGDRKITDEFIVEFLGPIASEMHEKSAHKIEYLELRQKLAKKFDGRNKDMFLSKEQADDFIRIMKERTGLLEEVATGLYGFMHLTFKEYLAARVLADLSEDRVKEIGKNLFKIEWKEVVLLAAATLRKRDASDFVRAIAEKEAGHFQNLVLAGECINDMGRDRIFDALYDDLVQKMLDVALGDGFVEDRVKVGETLGWLDDPRDLRAFVKIEGGKYELEDIGKASLDSFEIGTYQVTNAWFEEFIKAGGYENKDYWSKEGKKWLDHTKAQQPRLWNDRKWKCPSSPVVGVSWYEAYAFTRWLSLERSDGYEYRLPDENEWQAAAAGFDKREYPWGRKWDKRKCNNGEIKIEKTSPVGIFKRGNTPDGISDLSGNVWEWTLSDYDSGRELDDFVFDLEFKEPHLPVLRGGSWGNQGDYCRCAYRFRSDPYYGNNDVGFRCARTITP